MSELNAFSQLSIALSIYIVIRPNAKARAFKRKFSFNKVEGEQTSSHT